MKNYYSFAYARVSTKKQSLEREIEAIKRYRPKIEECNIFTDKCSGELLNRPGMNKLKESICNHINKNRDIQIEVIITEVDRLGRNKSIVEEYFKWFKEHGVKLRILELNITLENNNDIVNDVILQTLIEMYAIIANKELEKIKKRTAEGKAIARQNPNYKEGRPKKFREEELSTAIGMLSIRTYKEVENATGISVSTLKREKKKMKDLQTYEAYLNIQRELNSCITNNEESDKLDGYDF